MKKGDMSEEKRVGKKIDVCGPVCIRRCFDSDGEPAGVIVDYEFADDFHYTLNENAWQSFCDEYLNGNNSPYAFRDFLSEHSLDTVEGEFAFEDALKASNIEFKKIAFY